MSSLIRRPSCQSCRRRAELQAETIRAVSRRAGRRRAELQTEAIRAVSRRVRRRRAELQAEAIRAGSRRGCRRRSVGGGQEGDGAREELLEGLGPSGGREMQQGGT
jgi:hypothetical protein